MKMLLFFSQSISWKEEHQICTVWACLILQHTIVLHVWGTCLSKTLPALCILGKLDLVEDKLQVASGYVVSPHTLFPTWTAFLMSCDSELLSLIKSQRTVDIYKLTYLIAKRILVIYYSARPQLNCMQNLTMNFTKLQVLENIHILLVQRSQSWMQDSRWDLTWTEESSRIPPLPAHTVGMQPTSWLVSRLPTHTAGTYPPSNPPSPSSLSPPLQTSVAAICVTQDPASPSTTQAGWGPSHILGAKQHTLLQLSLCCSPQHPEAAAGVLPAHSWGLAGSAGRTAGLHNAHEAVGNLALALVISCWPCQSLTLSCREGLKHQGLGFWWTALRSLLLSS